MSIIRKFLYLLNLIITSIIGLIVLLTPNLRIFFIKTEVSNLLIIIITVLALIILSILPLVKDTNQMNIISIISLIIFSISLYYTSYQLISWYTSTIEGSYNLRFITFVRNATLDDKVKCYNDLIAMMLQSYSQKHPDYSSLIMYLQKSPTVTQPSSYVLASTPYNQLATLAEHNMIEGITQYNNYMSSIKPNNFFTYKKIITITLVTGSLVALAFIFNVFSITDLVKKGFNLSTKASTEVSKNMTSLSDSHDQLAKLADNVATVGASVLELTNKVNVLQTQIENINQTMLIHTTGILMAKRTISFIFRVGLRFGYQPSLEKLAHMDSLRDIADYLNALKTSI